MRCPYCGLLQDEPEGVKSCKRCGGELAYEPEFLSGVIGGYIQVQMELDQVRAPSGETVDRYLLVTLSTPKEVPVKEKAPTRTGRDPISFTAVLDTSGSMGGQKIEGAKEAVRQAILRLADGDIFSLVTFSSREKLVQKATVMDERQREALTRLVSGIQAGGETALHGGLELGMVQAKKSRQKTNLVMILSDGLANVGETDLEKIGRIAVDGRKADVITSALGIGEDYNEALMANIASEGGGRFYHLEDASQIGPFLNGELGEVINFAARKVQITVKLPKGALLMPLSSAYLAETHGALTTVDVGVIPLDTELEIPLRVTFAAQKEDTKISVEGNLSYLTPANHPITTDINRVTVRFVKKAQFQMTEGVVVPVAEKVLGQMRAAQVLRFSRFRYTPGVNAVEEAQKDIDAIFQYASRLGEKRAMQEKQKLDMEIHEMDLSPLYAKFAQNVAYRRIRSTKDFGNR